MFGPTDDESATVPPLQRHPDDRVADPKRAAADPDGMVALTCIVYVEHLLEQVRPFGGDHDVFEVAPQGALVHNGRDGLEAPVG